jgi:MFS family permease
VFLALWGVRELSTTDPLVDLRLVRHRVVLTANLGGGLLGLAMYMAIALMTQFVQLDADGFGLGDTIFITGLALTPLSAGSFVASRFLTVLSARLGPRGVLAIGSLVVGLGMVIFALTLEALWQILVAMGIIGIGLGLTFAALPGLIVSSTPRSETGSATGFYQVSRYVGFAIGSGLSITLLRAFGGDTAGAYRGTLLVGAAICVVAAVVCWVLPGPAVQPAGSVSERTEPGDEIVRAAGLELLEERRPT